MITIFNTFQGNSEIIGLHSYSIFVNIGKIKEGVKKIISWNAMAQLQQEMRPGFLKNRDYIGKIRVVAYR